MPYPYVHATPSPALATPFDGLLRGHARYGAVLVTGEPERGALCMGLGLGLGLGLGFSLGFRLGLGLPSLETYGRRALDEPIEYRLCVCV